MSVFPYQARLGDAHDAVTVLMEDGGASFIRFDDGTHASCCTSYVTPLPTREDIAAKHAEAFAAGYKVGCMTRPYTILTATMLKCADELKEAGL